MRVVHYHRRPVRSYYSIERLFSAVRESLPADIDCRVAMMPCYSRGIARRVWNCIDAPLRKGDVNHITGDIHYIAATLPAERTVLTVHDCVLLDRANPRLRSFYRLFWYTMPARRSRIVTFDSTAILQRFRELIPLDISKARIVPACVTSDLRYVPKPALDGIPRILHVGTAPHKNLLGVAEALKGIHCTLDIIGAPPPPQMEALKRNQIDFTVYSGITDDAVRERYEACDLVVFPSLYEGFGLPIAEAQTVGRPVITSNLWSMPEVAGDGAAIVDPHDVSAIREAVVRILDDAGYRGELVERGLDNARRFQARTVAEQFSAIYREVYGVHGTEHIPSVQGAVK